MTTPASTPRLTIVIPTVNRPHLVGRAIESALAQTAQDIEIVVSDNGSTDETQDVISRYRDPRLRCLRHEERIPASAHGNYLTKQARGAFLLPLSDDDYLEPDMASSVIDLFDREPDLSFVYTGCWIHYGTEPFPSRTGPEVEGGMDFMKAYFAEKRELSWCACVTRVDDLRNIGPLPEGLIFGDYYYWMKLVFRGSVGCIPAPLAHYTFMTDNNLSSATPVLEWASEVRRHADEVLRTFGQISNDSRATAEMRRISATWVARSIANQFVWNATRGTNISALMRGFFTCLPLFAHEWSAWPRVAMALTLPRSLLQRLILRAAARRRAKLFQAAPLFDPTPGR